MSKKANEVNTAPFINDIIADAFEMFRPLADAVIDIQLKHGHVPLTEPVTLRSLLAMPMDEAVQMLAGMIDQGTQIDPATGAILSIDPKALELAAEYTDAIDRRLGGDRSAT